MILPTDTKTPFNNKGIIHIYKRIKNFSNQNLKETVDVLGAHNEESGSRKSNTHMY